MSCARCSPIKRPFPDRGFTMVELMVSAAILIFIFAAVFTLFDAGNSIFNNDAGLMDLEQEVRIAMDIISRELRQTSSENLNISAGGGRIDFKMPTNITADPVVFSSNISYYLSGNQLVRENPPGTTEIIGNNINNLSFCCWSGGTCGTSCAGSDVVEAAFTAGKTIRLRPITFSIKEKMRVRN